MKKITIKILTFLAIVCCWQANAQFTESFETEIPSNWTVINGGGANGWLQSNTPDVPAQDGTGVASLTYNLTAHNDYLITPAITVAANTSDRLSLYIRSRSSTFLESYEILLSDTDALEASFTTVLQASSEAPSTWTELTFDLSSYLGQTVYVAVRATGTNEWFIYADNFVNDGLPNCNPGVATATVVEDCVAETYMINLNFTTLGDATDVSDGTTTYAINGTNTVAGPYAFGTEVTLDVLHSDGACDFELGTYNYFGCPPVNDECTGAIDLTVNSDFDCTNVTSGTVFNATDSGANDATCYGTPDDDVWYSFVATATEHRVSLTNITGTTTDMYMTFYNGTAGCGALGDSIACSDPQTANLSDLIIGDLYYVQVYTYSSTGGQTSAFDICVGSSPCETAEATATVTEDCAAETYMIDVDVTNVGSAVEITDGTNTVAISETGIIPFGPYAFGTSVTLDIIHDFVDCDFTLGTYDIAGCPPDNDDCENPIALTVNPDYSCTVVTAGTNLYATESSQADDVVGTPDNDVWFSFTATSEEHRISLTNITAVIGTSVDMVMAVYDVTSGCDALILIDDSDPNLFNVSGLTVGTEYILRVYGYYNSSSSSYAQTTFDVCIGTLPTCLPPTALSVANLTQTSADLGWTAGGSETTWNIEVVDLTAGESQTMTATDAGVTTNPFTVTDLVAENNYEFYIQADCGSGDLSEWSGPFAFTTSCEAINTFPSTTDFTTNPATVCWTEAGEGEVADGPTGSSSDWRDGRAYEDGEGDAVNSNAINLYQNIDREWLLSPVYDIPVGIEYMLVVNVAVTNYSSSSTPTTTEDTMGSDDEVQLLMTVDNGATWANLTTWNVANQPSVNGTEFIADLAAVSGNVQFALWASDGTVDDSEDYDFHIGQFEVSLSTLSTSQFSVENNFTYYPNPVENTLSLKGVKNIQNVAVYNMLGQEVLRITPNAVASEVDMSSLQTGTYFVKVTIENATKTIKVLKE